MVIRGESQAIRPGHLGALAAAAAEDPYLDIRALARDDVRLDTLSRTVTAAQQREDVVHLLAVVLCLRAGLLQQRFLQPEPGRLEQVLGGEPRGNPQAVGRRAVNHLSPVRLRRRAPMAGWPSSRTAEAEVKASGMEGVDEPNSSTVDSAVRWPSCTAPEPIRMAEVAAAVRARTTAGDVPATPGLRWCSANQ